MSKIISIFWAFLLCMLFLSACLHPAEIQYSSFVTDIANDGVLGGIEAEFWQYDSSESSDALQSVTFSFDEDIITGRYENSRQSYFFSYIDDYYDAGDIDFCLNSKTGDLTFISFSGNKNFYQTEPYLSDVANPEEYALQMAEKIASKYIDISKYTLLPVESHEYICEKDGVEYGFTTYIIDYCKVFCGIKTTDYVRICITSKGHLCTLRLGELGAFDALDLESISIPTVNSSVARKIQNAYAEASYQYVRHEIGEQLMCYTPEGSFVIVSDVYVTIKNNLDKELTTGLEITTVISDETKLPTS